MRNVGGKPKIPLDNRKNEFMDTIIGEVLMHLIGRISLNIRYRSKEKIKRILEEKYLGSYSNAGREYGIYILAIPLGLLIFGLIMAGLISMFKM